MNKLVLAKFIKKRRLALNISQKDLATMLGFKTPQFISNIERGVSSIPINKIKDFSKVLAIDEKDLSQILSITFKNKILNINNIKEVDDSSLFFEKLIFAYRVAEEKDKELFKNMAIKFFKIEDN